MTGKQVELCKALGRIEVHYMPAHGSPADLNKRLGERTCSSAQAGSPPAAKDQYGNIGL